MKPGLDIVEQDEGFIYITIKTESNILKFWIIPDRNTGKKRLCYKFSGKLNAQGQTKINTGGQENGEER